VDLGPGVLVTHSCAPNAGIRDNVRLIAITDIRAGAEIFYDYSTTMNEDHRPLECLCGSALCRGKVVDFKDLPVRTRRSYLRLGIVQAYPAAELPVPSATSCSCKNRGAKSGRQPGRGAASERAFAA
jgi:hypothetical protein